MKRAFVLVSIKIGLEEEVQKQIRNLKFVKETHRVLGIYDAIATLEFETAEDLTNVMVKIREIEGVEATTTMPVESGFTKEI